MQKRLGSVVTESAPALNRAMLIVQEACDYPPFVRYGTKLDGKNSSFPQMEDTQSMVVSGGVTSTTPSWTWTRTMARDIWELTHITRNTLSAFNKLDNSTYAKSSSLAASVSKAVRGV